ncbi:hypothetical protein Agabi119p4_3172 [Agaricus bisporus var. burnettii]|uniref:Uncharacterized protein n=1 Tax=Agaricus bisporus var. burnettii TaxID=192524 RepID=A0A8H7F6K5_AGABI|nr:hypothetical protein Agabi119p4_3172 [Agaricus bisporus var. burnettii]
MSAFSSPRSASSPALTRSPSPVSDQPHYSDDSDSGQSSPGPLYLGHTRWKQAQPHTPGQHHTLLPNNDDPGTHRRKKVRTRYTTYRKVYHEQHLSRDFFLILTFCFVLACFLVCLTRPALRTWFSNPVSFVDLDEF